MTQPLLRCNHRMAYVTSSSSESPFFGQELLAILIQVCNAYPPKVLNTRPCHLIQQTKVGIHAIIIPTITATAMWTHLSRKHGRLRYGEAMHPGPNANNPHKSTLRRAIDVVDFSARNPDNALTCPTAVQPNVICLNGHRIHIIPSTIRKEANNKGWKHIQCPLCITARRASTFKCLFCRTPVNTCLTKCDQSMSHQQPDVAPTTTNASTIHARCPQGHLWHMPLAAIARTPAANAWRHIACQQCKRSYRATSYTCQQCAKPITKCTTCGTAALPTQQTTEMPQHQTTLPPVLTSNHTQQPQNSAIVPVSTEVTTPVVHQATPPAIAQLQQSTLLTITTTNITALGPNQAQLAERSGTTLLRELAIHQRQTDMYKAAFAASKIQAFVSVPAAETAKPAAGVGILTTGDDHAIQCSPIGDNQSMTQAIALGRASIYIHTWGTDYILIYNLYLWSGSQKDATSRTLGDKVLAAVIKDIRARGHAHYIIAGDLNADTTVYAALHAFMQEGLIVDPATCIWPSSSTRNQATCFAAHAATCTRRDYMLLNPTVAAHTTDMETGPIGAFAVHLPVTITIGTPHPAGPTYTPVYRTSLTDLMPKPEEPKETKELWWARVASQQQQLYEHATPQLTSLLRQGQLEKFWVIFVQLFEISIIEASNIAMPIDNPKLYRGRAIPKFEQRKHASPTPPDPNQLHKAAHIQSRRLQAAATITLMSPTERLPNWKHKQHATNALKAYSIHAHACEQPAIDNDTLVAILQGQRSGTGAHVVLAAATRKKLKRAHLLQAAYLTNRSKEAKLKLATDPSAMFRRTKPSFAQGVNFIADQDGELIADPAKVEAEFAHQYDAFFNKQAESTDRALVDSFVNKYAQYIPQRAECSRIPITPEALLIHIKDATPSSSGFDGFKPQEAKLLTIHALRWLAEFYHQVEDRGWAYIFKHVKLSPILKPGEDPLQPLSYRLISVAH